MYAITITRNDTILYVYKARTLTEAKKVLKRQGEIEAYICDGDTFSSERGGKWGWVHRDNKVLKTLTIHKMLKSED